MSQKLSRVLQYAFEALRVRGSRDLSRTPMPLAMNGRTDDA
jgi:hypothetical protein